jgi:twitching motility protein PilT
MSSWSAKCATWKRWKPPSTPRKPGIWCWPPCTPSMRPESINRIVSVFPPHQHRQIRSQLSGILRAVISQRLVPRADGKGRVPAVEVMISTARTRDLIDDKEKTKLLRDAIQQGFVSYGMQTFDQSLMGLYRNELITFDEAIRQSSNPDDFKLKASGISSTSDLSWDDFGKSAEDEQPADAPR